MSEASTSDPRWGTHGRNRKAAAILHTLRSSCGPNVGSGRWLDVGCGSGGIAAALADFVDHIEGVDIEPWERWVSYMDQHQNLQLKTGRCDAENIPMARSAYDVIICNQVYEHVANPRQLLSNIEQMLKPQGVCYFAGPNLLWPVEPHVYLPCVHWLPRRLALRLMRALGSKHMEDLDAYSSTWWKLHSWFRQCGFEPRNAIPERLLAVEGDSFAAAAARMLGKLPRHLHAALGPFAPAFVFVLRKKTT